MNVADTREKIVTFEALLARRAQWRRELRRVVWTNGCFDLLHTGHVRGLEAAAALGDVLVVGLNSDASVRRIKGPSRPVVPQAERAEMLAALAGVDAVCIFEEDSPAALLIRLQPEIFCKGAQFGPGSGAVIPEAAAVQAYGGEIRYTPMLADHSTTALLARITATTAVAGLRP